MNRKIDGQEIFVVMDEDKLAAANVRRTFMHRTDMLPDEVYMSNLKKWSEDDVARYSQHMRMIKRDGELTMSAERMDDDGEQGGPEDRFPDPDITFAIYDPVANTLHKDGNTTDYRFGNFLIQTKRVRYRRTAEPIEKEALYSRPLVPPGSSLISIAKALAGQQRYDRYVKPHIADIQFEYADAMGKGQKFLAWIRLIRGFALWLIPLGYAVWKKLGPLWNWASK